MMFPQLPDLPEGESTEDELDALDTVSSWDEELAQMKAWEAQQKGFAAETAGGAEGPHVDEEAHLGLDDDDDESPAEEQQRQLEEMKAAMLLMDAAKSGAASDAAGSSDSRVLTSLDSVLRTMMRLEQKVDALSAAVDKLSQRAAGPGAAPGTDAWDGEVDENAWFDQDDDDLPDWRDVRRLNKLL